MKLHTPTIAVAAALAAVLVVIAWSWSRADQPSAAAVDGRREQAAAQTDPVQLATVLPAPDERSSAPLPTEPSEAAEIEVQLSDPSSSEAREIQASAATTVHGVLLDADTRMPVGGVAVRFRRHDPVEWVYSDIQGRFSLFDVPARSRIGLEIVTPEYAPTTVSTSVHESPVEVLLERGELISVRVTDIETGHPIAEASFTDARSGHRLPGSHADGVLRAHAKRPPGELFIDLEVNAPGYCPVRLPYRPGSPEPLEVPLLRSTSVVGRVVDSHGVPVKGARVTIDSKDLSLAQVEILRSGAFQVELLDGIPDEWRIGSEGHSCSSLTDADGRFRVDGLRPVAFEARARVRVRSLVTVCQPIGQLGPPGGSIEVHVGIPPGGTIPGVLRLNGTPTAGRVYWTCSGVSENEEADEQGNFSLEGVPEGRLKLRGIPQGYTVPSNLFAGALEIDFNGEAREPVVIDLSSQLGTIAGRVLDPRGEGIKDVFVFAYGSSTTTDGEGRFALEAPTDCGSFTVFASRGYESESLENVLPGSGDLLFHFGESGRLRVRARAPGSTETLTAFGVAWRRSGEGSYKISRAQIEPRDEDGFVVLDLFAGLADLVLVDPARKHAPRYLFAVRIPIDGEIVIDEQLDEAVAVEFDLDGEAPSDQTALYLFEEHLADELAKVDPDSYRWYLQWLPGFQGRRLVFDTEGRATVHGVGAGRFRILCQGENLHVEPEWIDVVPGDATPVVVRVTGQ